MTVSKLLEALKSHVIKSLENYTFKDDEGNIHPIHVTCGFLKERELMDNPHSFDKYVLIRAIKGKENIEESMATVRLIFCAKDIDTADGYMSVINMIEHVKQSILSRHFIGDKAFTYERNIAWELDEDEAYPQYFGFLEIPFYLGNPNELDIEI